MSACLLYYSLFLLAIVTMILAQIPSECERGVKRAHPTQENAFQILSRNGWRHQWLDGECPPPLLYDQSVCDCVEVPTPPEPPSSFFPQARESAQWSSPSDPPHLQAQNVQLQNNQLQQSEQAQQQQQQQQQQQEQRPSYLASPTGTTSVQEQCRFHRPNPDPTKYDRLSDRGWTTEDCNWPIYLGLVWNQDRCRCDWGEKLPVIRNSAPSVAIAKPCIVMLNMTFDRYVADESHNHWLNRKNENGVRIVPEPGSHGQCALFKDSSVSVPFFKSNTLGSLFSISLSFRECTDEDPDREIVLLHNGCADTRTPPTIALGYRPRTRIFMMEFGTTNDITTIREECQVNSERENRWIDVSVRYDGGYLEVIINGEVCIGTSQFSGDVKTTDCPLTLPGENVCVYMDELLILRGCSN